MLSEKGPDSLVRPHSSLQKPPITLLCDFLSQHASGNSINVPSDTVAGILYLYTKSNQEAMWLPSDAVQSQWKQIFDTALDAQDSLVRSWAIFAFAACGPLDAQRRHKVLEKARTDNAQTVRIAASFAVWHWHEPRPDDKQRNPTPSVEEQRDLTRFIMQASEDASYHVRAIAFGLAMEWVSYHRDTVLKEDWRPIPPSGGVDVDHCCDDSVGSHIIAALMRGSHDPLKYLEEAVGNFLIHLFKDPKIRKCPHWCFYFPSLSESAQESTETPSSPSVSSREFTSLQILMLSGLLKPQEEPTDRPLRQIAQPIQDPRLPCERPLGTQILNWRRNQESYFHAPRLTVCPTIRVLFSVISRLIMTAPKQWADSEKERSPEVSKSQHRSAQIAAYEVGGRAMSSWTESVLEVPTTERAQVLWYDVQWQGRFLGY